MGLAGYYRRFIEGFSINTYPITSLQKLGNFFYQTPECEAIIQNLRVLLTRALILKNFNPNENFLVCIDACKEGLIGLLMKNGQVIWYESRKLKYHENNYVSRDLKLLAIVYTLKICRHYLMGRILNYILIIKYCAIYLNNQI